MARLRVNSTDYELILWLRQTAGWGRIYEVKPKKENHKIQWQIQWVGLALGELLPAIQPYMVIKAARVKLVLELLNKKSEIDRKPYQPWPTDVVVAGQEAYETLKRMNMRGLGA